MKMRLKCSLLIPYVYGIAMIFLPLYFIIYKPQINIIHDVTLKHFELVKGTIGYERIWANFDMVFRVHIFDVINPDDVMQGAKPEFRDRGPYVYDMNIKKDVLMINEETDEIEYLTTRTYHFNKELSVGSENDEVTIINSGYLGSISMIVSGFPSFLKKLGNSIQKLFPGMEDLFIRAKVGDIIFHGLPMECDAKKYKELKLICGFLMSKKPPALKDTDVEGVYAYSFFDRMNGTAQGPLSVNRGVKNKTLLGDTTSFKGKRLQKYWKSDYCNRVVGTDSVTWAPMDIKLDHVVVYEPQICRSVITDFKKEVIYNGLVGWYYEVSENAWQPENVECYCPRVKKQIVCPPTGLVDLTPCQEAPIYYSEPHFLHGDPSLLEYAKGLNPNEKDHATYVLIEPFTGVPIVGSKKMQLSAKLINSPVVDLLANVSEGYFPILWVEEARNATIEDFVELYQAYRLLRLVDYLVFVPLIIGIFVILQTIYLQSYEETRTSVETIGSFDSILVRQNPRIVRSERSVTRRTRARLNRM